MPPPPPIAPAPPAVPPILPPLANISDYTPFIRRLIQRSQVLGETLTHRPTREDLLKAANSWWERFRIRLRWLTIRGWRRFNTDDFSAFFSWFVVGNSECLMLIIFANT
jgi:distribution and morphology protein 31